MKDPEVEPGSSLGVVRKAQILTGALVVGMVMFAGVVAFLSEKGLVQSDDSGELGVLVWVAGGLLLALLPVAFLLRSAVFGRAAGGSKLVRESGYQAGCLLFAATIEGGVLLNLVAVLLLGNWAVNGVAAAAGIMVMLAAFPTEAQYAELERS